MKYEKRYVFSEINGVPVTGYDVIIDTRERSHYSSSFINRFIELLDHFKYTWIKTKLPAGDILINRGRGLNIERKTVSDLINTAFGERNDGNALESELKRLVDPEVYGGYAIPTCLCCENGRTITIKTSYEKVIKEKQVRGKKVEVVEYIEKRSFSYKDHRGKRKTSKIYPNSWIAVTKKIQHYTRYYEFAGVDHFISWIISQLKKEIRYEKSVQNGEKYVTTLRMHNKVNTLTIDEQKRYILESIPNLGAKGAIKILKHYKTLRSFFMNVKHPEDLIKIGIRKKTAEYILSLIDHTFQDQEEIF